VQRLGDYTRQAVNQAHMLLFFNGRAFARMEQSPWAEHLLREQPDLGPNIVREIPNGIGADQVSGNLRCL
jgi:hypothetical protein